MTVISRLEGSPSTATSAASICSHLTTVVIPRVSPFLARQRAQQANRLAERRLREEQDRAYALAAQQDTARVLKMRAEQAQRLASERERQEAEARAAKLRDGARRWRAWQRGVLEREGEPPVGEARVARIGVRLGDGRRVVRRFGPESSIERVYAFVECALESEDDGERAGTCCPRSDSFIGGWSQH
jgi:FAS-associated factor 2